MAPRPVAGDYLRDSTPILSPTARPVDTYVRPSEQPSSSEALLRALGGLDAKINPILSKKEAAAQKVEVAEGQKAFMQNRSDFKEAITSGAIPAGASPYVRLGYRRAQQHTLGANYATELAAALETSDMHKIEDPAEIEKYLQGFHQEFAETNGLNDVDAVELAENFSPMAQQAHDRFRVRQVEKNIAYIEEERLVAFESEVLSLMDMHSFGGSRSQVGGAIAATASFLTEKAKELDHEGIDRAQINQRVLSMVVAAAVGREDTDILDILKHVKLGTGTIYNTASGRKATAQAERAIISASNARAAQGRAAQAAADKARKQELGAIIFDQTVDGTFDINSDEVQELKRRDARAAMSAVNWNETREKAVAEDAQQASFGFARAAVSGEPTFEDAQQVANYMVQTNQMSISDADQALGDWKAVANTPALKRLMSDDYLKRTLSHIGKIAGGANQFGFPQDPLAHAEAIAGTNRVMIEWYNENRRPDGTVNYDDFYSKISSLTGQMEKVYGGDGGGFSSKVDVPSTKVNPDGTAAKLTDIPD